MPVSRPDPLPPPPPPRNGRPSIEWHGVVSCICTVQWRSLFKLIGMFNVMRLWTVPLHPSFFTLSFGHGSLCGQLAFGASGGSACSRRPGHTLCHWRHCGRWTCPLLDHQLPSPSSLAWPVACGPAAGLDAWVAHALRGRLLTGRHRRLLGGHVSLCKHVICWDSGLLNHCFETPQHFMPSQDTFTRSFRNQVFLMADCVIPLHPWIEALHLDCLPGDVCLQAVSNARIAPH